MLQYLLKLSISLAVLFMFYRAVLRPLTFYQCNRFYLLCYSLLCFVIPFINITPWITKDGLPANQIVNIIPSIGNYSVSPQYKATSVQSSFLKDITASQWLLLLFCLGALVMLIRMLLQYASVQRIRRKAVLLDNNANVQLYETDAMVSPFSFGNAIYFNRTLHTEEELQRIIQHEFVHVKQKHTIDLIIGELLCIINWYNPFAWFIRYSIRQNLEFIADNNVVANGLDKKEYQYLLLKVVGVPQYSIANNFNFSNLKKRIAMMNKIKTARVHLSKFLFVLPLLAVSLLAFRNSSKNNGTSSKRFDIDSTPSRLFSAERMQKDMASIQQFLANNPSVRLFYSTEDKKKQFVFLKDGSVEQYGYAGTGSLADMENKYGILPESFTLDEMQHTDYNARWQHLSGEVAKTFISVNEDARKIIFPGDSRVLVQLKNNKVDIYDMDYQQERDKFEALYGKLPAILPVSERNDTIPPPPPAPPVLAAPALDNAPFVTVLDAAPARPSTPAKPNQKGYTITVADNNGEPVVLVKDTKKRIVKAVTMGEWNANKKEYETKYGALPPPPPPPAPAKIANLLKPGKAVPPAVELNYGELSSQPLYVIDGVQQTNGFKENTLPPDKIKSIDILKGKDATEKYGNMGINGVIEINTKMSRPLYVVDNEIQPGDFNLNKINADDIESIRVLKDKSGMDKYGEKAKNGVIEITLKKKYQQGKAPVKQPVITWESPTIDKMKFDSAITMRLGEGTDAVEVTMKKNVISYSPADVLVVLDGTELSAQGSISNYIKQEDIANMKAMAGREAITKYGDKGKKGVIEIQSKKAKPVVFASKKARVFNGTGYFNY